MHDVNNLLINYKVSGNSGSEMQNKKKTRTVINKNLMKATKKIQHFSCLIKNTFNEQIT